MKKLFDFYRFSSFVMQVFNGIYTLFHTYQIDERWYPVMWVIGFLLCILIIYIIFAFIRSFLAWLWKVDDAIKEQEKTNEILLEIYHLMNTTVEQNDIIIENLISRKNSPAHNHENSSLSERRKRRRFSAKR